MKINLFLVGLTGILLLGACAPTSLPPTAPATQPPTIATVEKTRAPLPATWTPTLTPTIIPTGIPRNTIAPTPTRTPVPTRTPAPTPTATLTPTETLTATAFTTSTAVLSGTATLSDTAGLSGTTATGTISATATPKPGPKILVGKFDTDRAIGLIYNNPTASSYITAALALPFKQNGEDKIFFITEIPGENCPTCKASIGGAVFVKTNTSWQIESEQRHIAMVGAYGRTPSGELVEIGQDRFGLLFYEAYTDTQQFSRQAVLIAPLDDGIRLVFTAQTDAGAFQNGKIVWEYHSDVTLAQGNHPLYYEITVTTRGDKPAGNTIQPFETTSLYVFMKTEYRLAGTQ
ncbi:MAG: hypothetical protein JXA21_25105 [Anaerolineae bacterium]|nr:hypothetical protein [Anaerolineae bacterium]